MLTLFAQAEFAGLDGFLGTRASLMMDIVVTAMFAVLPVMAASIWAVRYRKNYRWHKRVQLTLGIVLLVTVMAFELDIQFISLWEQRAEPSPYFDVENQWTCPAGISLLVHLCFAVPTLGLWVFVIVQALRKFPRPAAPSPYSRRHIVTARLAAAGMIMTAVTGWTFYALAFAL